MLALVRKLSAFLIIPLTWTLLTIVLLCLPGSTINSIGLSNIPNIDKIVHFILFGTIPLLWGYYFLNRFSLARWKKTVFLFVIGSISLGIVLEFVQYFFIPNRSFDPLDILADSVGAMSFGWVLVRVEGKGQ